MATVVQFGAGAIGRGYLAQLWQEAGYETVFVDADAVLVARLNAARSYRLRLLGSDAPTQTIAPVWAIWAGDTGAVTEELTTCAFAATAVGARNVADVARFVLPAVSRRKSPLNVLLCENGAAVRGDFVAALGDAAESVGVVKTVVGRTVPEPRTDTLELIAESYNELPFRVDDWRGNPPGIAGLVAVDATTFPAYELRKRFLHNGGHALLAYHGALRGYEWLTQCANDAAIVTELCGFWAEVMAAFARSEHGDVTIFAPAALASYTDDLLTRFRAPELGDTVARVARDPLRKLAANERLTGAALYCLVSDVEPVHARRAMVAALQFAGFGVATSHAKTASLLAF